MNHLFIPYNLAELAHDKGFRDETLAAYYSFEDGESYTTPELHLDGRDTLEDREYELNKRSYVNCDAPLYCQITDWLRDKHHMHIHVCFFYETAIWNADIYDILRPDNGLLNSPNSIRGETYYDAMNKSIYHALGLLPSVPDTDTMDISFQTNS